ncbi:MAG: PIN domain-containing protein [bacterium]|nr:PIN domain-containing protein [bacterium]
MKKVFIDTSAWVAINSKDDQYHNEDCLINQKLIIEGYRYITTNFVLDETYTFMRYEVSHKKAVEFGHEVVKLEKSRKVEVVPVSKEIEKSAWEIFEWYDDKDFSFTDCTSFMIMEQLGVTEVFTFDHHFEQYKFTQIGVGLK